MNHTPLRSRLFVCLLFVFESHPAWGQSDGKDAATCKKALGEYRDDNPYYQPYVRVDRGGQIAAYERKNRDLDEITRLYGTSRVDITTLRGKRILDAGTGGGQFVLDLRHEGVNAVGMDLVLDEPQKQMPTIFIEGDIRFTPFENGSFDGIFSTWSVFSYELRNKSLITGIVDEFYRILKPGGFVRLFPVSRIYISPVLSSKKKYTFLPLTVLSQRLSHRKGKLFIHLSQSIKEKNYMFDMATLGLISYMLDRGFDVHLRTYEGPNPKGKGSLLVEAVKLSVS